MKRRNENAITLVALIITIIIMLILAGAVLYFSIGENGLIKISKEAAKKYQNATNNELMQLNFINENLNDNDFMNNNETEGNSQKREVILLEANCSSRYTKTISVSHIQGYENFTEDNFFQFLKHMEYAQTSGDQDHSTFEKLYNAETGELTLSVCTLCTGGGSVMYNIYDVYLIK